MTGKHVLLVEKEKGLQLVLSLMLRQAGFRTTISESNSTAIELIRTSASTVDRIDLLVTDIDRRKEIDRQMLNALAGVKVHIPVIAITEYADDALVAELTKSGYTTFISKPFEPEQLMNCIHNSFKNS